MPLLEEKLEYKKYRRCRMPRRYGLQEMSRLEGERISSNNILQEQRTRVMSQK